MDENGTEEGQVAALAHEKARLWGKKKPTKSKDPEIRGLQEAGLDVPVALAKIVIRESKAKRNDELMDSIDPKATPQ